jgi:DNA-binding MarR family transcriptional regulator
MSESSENAAPSVAADAEQTAVNPLDHLLGYQLRRASFAMLADISAALANLDMRLTETSILLVIDANPDITQSEIGRILTIQRANMVPLAALLGRRKLIRRASTKGRAHALRLTPAGKALAEECRRRIAAHEAKFLPDISQSERTALIKQLRGIWSRPG